MAIQTEYIDSNYKWKKQLRRENHSYRKKKWQVKENYGRRKRIGHCERRRKVTAWSERNEERDGSNAFFVPVKRTKRISGSANVNVGRRRMANSNGMRKRGLRVEGRKEEKGKRMARWPPRVPARLPRRRTYAILQSLASSALGPAERVRERRLGMGIVVSNFVLLYALYGDAPYIIAVSLSVLPRIRTQSQPGFDTVVHFQNTCPRLNERADSRTIEF